MTTPASIFPPQTTRCAGKSLRRIDERVLTALALARQTLDRAAARARTRAMRGFDDLVLPEGTPTPADNQQLESAASLYLAREFEQAGVLRTAELIAGLFASGAINQPLGPTEQIIASFWKDRVHRLSAAERTQIFDHVFAPSEFYPLLTALCNALVNEDDDLAQAGDVRTRVQLEQAASSLAEWLAPRTLGMAAYAAQDIVSALTQATHFMRDRTVQLAFGVQDFWGLLDVVGSSAGAQPGRAHRWVELGQNGAKVLTWLTQTGSTNMSVDPSRRDDQEIIAAAERWLMDWAQAGSELAHETTGAPGLGPALTGSSPADKSSAGLPTAGQAPTVSDLQP
jgi:hypothetical protein